MKKRLFSILLSLAMVVTMMPAMAWAASDQGDESLPYILYEESYNLMPTQNVHVAKNGWTEKEEDQQITMEIVGEPTVTSDYDDWYTIKENPNDTNEFLVEVKDTAESGRSGQVTVKYNVTYPDEKKGIIEEKFDITVITELFTIGYTFEDGSETNGCWNGGMVFGQHCNVQAHSYMISYNPTTKEIEEREISGSTYEISYDRSMTNGGVVTTGPVFTHLDTLAPDKWRITANQVGTGGLTRDDEGGDIYHITATNGSNEAMAGQPFSVSSSNVVIEPLDGEGKIELQAGTSNNKILLSNYAIYKYTLANDNRTINKESVTNPISFQGYDVNVLELDNDGNLVLNSDWNKAYDGWINVTSSFKEPDGTLGIGLSLEVIVVPSGGGGSDPVVPVEPTKPEPSIDVDPASGGVVVNLGGDTKVEGKTASAVITADTAKKIIDAAAKSGTTEIKLDATVGESVNKTELEIPMAIADVADTNGASVEIATNIGSVILDKQTIHGIAKIGADSITVAVEKTAESSDSKAVFNIALTSAKDGKTTTISKLQGTAQVVATLPNGVKAEEACGLYLNGKLAEKVDTTIDGNKVTLTVKHFSTYGVMSNADANKLFKKSAEATTMGKLTLKAYKGGKIKASWKNGKGNTGDITKYQVCYKQSGKAAKYTTTTSRSKTIKKLKKGKTYTVKTRAYIKINGKTYKSKWSSAKSIKCK